MTAHQEPFVRPHVQLIESDAGVPVLFVRDGYRWTQVDITDDRFQDDLIALGEELTRRRGTLYPYTCEGCGKHYRTQAATWICDTEHREHARRIRGGRK